ncbi:MAG: serine/threonine protein kinase, partial [Chloroflexota bacterium]|nr:serine/threonine protein kinase [Chloroflexota bacterium]
MMNEPKNNVGTIDRAGQQLGNYRLISSLELDKYSRMYLAEHIQFKHQCIVKVWQVQLKQELADGFLKQAQAQTQLVHPHILRVRDAGVENLTPFLAIDYTPHTTLQQRSSRSLPRPLVSILPHLQPLAEALQYAHTNGFIHKNVRPRNILLDRNNDVLLSNFSIAAITQSEQQPNHLRAEEVTELLGYMAPEQMQGKAVPASDQYGLAVVIYEWLNGDLPFHGSYGEMVNQHLHVQPPSLRKKVPALPSAIEEVIFTALAKDPHQRFSSIAAFIQALQQEYSKASSPVVAYPRPFFSSTGVDDPPAQQAVLTPPPPPVLANAAPVISIPAAPVQYAPVAPASYPQYAPPTPMTPAPPAKARNTPPPQPKAKGRATISRRAFVAGLVGVAALGGGGAWLAFSQRLPAPSFASNAPNASANQPTNPNQQGTILVYHGHPARVDAVAWSPDSKRIASASDDHTVQICDAQTGATSLTYRGHAAEVYALSWSPDGKYLASAGADKTVQVWDAATGASFRTYKGHSDQVNAVSWSSDSKLIASGSDDHTVQVWNITNGAAVMIYSEHSAGVLAVAWSPDNTRIASGSWDNTVKAFSTIQTESFAIGGTVFD